MSNTSQQQVMQIEREFAQIYQRCQPHTMCDLIKCHNLYKAVCYVTEQRIPGALVECGVWKGGSSMLMALTALLRKQSQRELWLFDTFAGMTRPTDADVKASGEAAAGKWDDHQQENHNAWCYGPLAEVKTNMASTGYPGENTRFVVGPVEQTIPKHMPDEVAILRLDTDFYESTWHELEHLYPRLAPGGVLILDDYNYWQGQRAAALEYFAEREVGMMLTFASTSATGVKATPYGLTKAEREAMCRSSAKSSSQITPNAKDIVPAPVPAA